MKTSCDYGRFRAGVEHFSFILERFGISRETLDLLISDELKPGSKNSSPVIKRLQKALFKLCNAIASELTNDKEIEQIVRTYGENAANSIRFTAILLELRRLLGPQNFLHILYQFRQKYGQRGSGNGEGEEGKEGKEDKGESNVAAAASPSTEIVVASPRDSVNPNSAVNLYASQLAQPRGDGTPLALSLGQRRTTKQVQSAIVQNVKEEIQATAKPEEINKSTLIIENMQRNKLAEIENNPQVIDDFISELNTLTEEESDLNIFFKQEMKKIRDLLKKKFKVEQASQRVEASIKRSKTARTKLIIYHSLESLATLTAAAGAYLYYLRDPKQDCSVEEGWGAAKCYGLQGASYLNPLSWGKSAVANTATYVAPAFIGMSIYRNAQALMSTQQAFLKNNEKMKSNLEEVIRVYDGIIDDNIGALEQEIQTQINSIETSNKHLVPALMGYLQGDIKDGGKQKARSYIKQAINRLKLHYNSADLILPQEDATRLSSALSALNASLNDENTGKILDNLQQKLMEHSVKQQLSGTKRNVKSAARFAATGALKLGANVATAYGGPAAGAAVRAMTTRGNTASTAGQGKRRKTKKYKRNSVKTKKVKKPNGKNKVVTKHRKRK